MHLKLNRGDNIHASKGRKLTFPDSVTNKPGIVINQVQVITYSTYITLIISSIRFHFCHVY
jgi:hypothetical protein